MLKLLYVYPQFHMVSFTLIAKKHIQYLKMTGDAEVGELDELALPSYVPNKKYIAVLHPWVFVYHRFLQARQNALDKNLVFKFDKYIEWWRSNYEALVAIDVCDSDKMSDYAVNLLNQADRVIVPSSYCADVYKQSGVNRPVFRVPHGLDPEWYSLPNVWNIAPAKSVNPALLELYLYKIRKKRRFLLFWLWHSENRKGWPEVKAAYSELIKTHKDVVLVLKTMTPNSPAFQEVMHQGAIQIYGWLSDYDKMALYDLADITLMFSRGGAFEANALESFARGIPAVTSNVGSWVDYVPDFLRVKAGDKVKVFDDNIIHVGLGNKIDVDDAVNKIHDILNNYDEYKAKTEQWKLDALANEYRWDIIAKNLAGIIKTYIPI